MVAGQGARDGVATTGLLTVLAHVACSAPVSRHIMHMYVHITAAASEYWPLGRAITHQTHLLTTPQRLADVSSTFASSENPSAAPFPEWRASAALLRTGCAARQQRRCENSTKGTLQLQRGDPADAEAHKNVTV